MKASINRAINCAAAMARCKQAEAINKQLAATKARIREGEQTIKAFTTYDEAYNFYFSSREALIKQQNELNNTEATAPDYELKYWNVLLTLSELEQVQARIRGGSLQGSF